MSKIVFIVNPHAGNGSTGSTWPLIESLARDRIGPFEAYMTRGPEDIFKSYKLKKNLHAMKRSKEYIIFPLDVPTVEKAKAYVELLWESVGMFKVGLELFIRSGTTLIDFIHATAAAQVFLDLKLHDIPATVSRAMAHIADLGVKFATVHCGESRRMLEAAVTGAKGRVGVLGVTVLTSVSGEDIKAAGYQKPFYEDPARLVVERAAMARTAGCAGIVCSGREVRMIKKTFGRDFIAVTPGIRPLWEDMESNDQKRVATPAAAIENGADYLVIGRPIRDAKNPKEAARRIAEEIDSVLSLDNAVKLDK